MNTIGAFAAKTHFSALIEQVERGEQVVITKHGRPVAKLVPATEIKSHERAKLAVERIREFSKNLTLGGIDWKTLRDEGRK